MLPFLRKSTVQLFHVYKTEFSYWGFILSEFFIQLSLVSLCELVSSSTSDFYHICLYNTAATDADSKLVQTLNSATAGFDEFSMGLRSRRRCISTSRWWFSHSCTARFTSFKMFLLHSCARVSNSYSVVFAATFQQQPSISVFNSINND